MIDCCFEMSNNLGIEEVWQLLAFSDEYQPSENWDDNQHHPADAIADDKLNDILEKA